MNKIGKNSAFARIQSLLDAGSFVELGAMVSARSTDFHLYEQDTPADGVITGYGQIEGRLVYVYSQDAAVLGGAIGEMHAKKIAQIYDKALQMGAPVIGIIDCAGVRLLEGEDALYGLGTIYQKQAIASGVIPQFSMIFGSCGGGVSLIPALSDFTLVESKQSNYFLQSPDAIPNNTTAKCDTSAPEWKGTKAGNIDFIGTADELYAEVRRLIDILPANNRFRIMPDICNDDLNRTCADLADSAADTATVLSILSDQYAFVETKKMYAKEMVTGFIRLNGMTVGCVANRSYISDDEASVPAVLTSAGVAKASAFIKYCDSFHIPLLTLSNVAGFESTFEAEVSLGASCASMISAYACATVPKVTVVLEQAMGSAGIAMGSKSVGADLVYSWPSAKIGPMEAASAAKILYADKPAAEAREKTKEYDERYNSAASSAARGYVDALIKPEDTRKYLISAFEMLASKQESMPFKRHTSI